MGALLLNSLNYKGISQEGLKTWSFRVVLFLSKIWRQKESNMLHLSYTFWVCYECLSLLLKFLLVSRESHKATQIIVSSSHSFRECFLED